MGLRESTRKEFAVVNAIDGNISPSVGWEDCLSPSGKSSLFAGLEQLAFLPVHLGLTLRSDSEHSMRSGCISVGDFLEAETGILN